MKPDCAGVGWGEAHSGAFGVEPATPALTTHLALGGLPVRPARSPPHPGSPNPHSPRTPIPPRQGPRAQPKPRVPRHPALAPVASVPVSSPGSDRGAEGGSRPRLNPRVGLYPAVSPTPPLPPSPAPAQDAAPHPSALGLSGLVSLASRGGRRATGKGVCRRTSFPRRVFPARRLGSRDPSLLLASFCLRESPRLLLTKHPPLQGPLLLAQSVPGRGRNLPGG